MSTVANWRGYITIPALPERRLKVGENTIVQQPFLETRQTIEIFDSPTRGPLSCMHQNG